MLETTRAWERKQSQLHLYRLNVCVPLPCGAGCQDGVCPSPARQPGAGDLHASAPQCRAESRSDLQTVAGRLQRWVPVEGALLQLLPHPARCATTPRSVAAIWRTVCMCVCVCVLIDWITPGSSVWQRRCRGTGSSGVCLTASPAWRSRLWGSTQTRSSIWPSPTGVTASPPAPRTALSRSDWARSWPACSCRRSLKTFACCGCLRVYPEAFFLVLLWFVKHPCERKQMLQGKAQRWKYWTFLLFFFFIEVLRCDLRRQRVTTSLQVSEN